MGLHYGVQGGKIVRNYLDGTNVIIRVLVRGRQRIKVRDRDLTAEVEVTETEI